MQLYYTDEALLDVDLAFYWYEKQKPGLGHIFLDSIEQSIKSIIDYPKAAPITHCSYHRKLIKKFPFSIFYTIKVKAIVVHAVFDNRQNPQKKPSK